jgi:hypothetical protein
MIREEKAKTKLCPFTFAIPMKQVSIDEYKCTASQCMAWKSLDSDLTGYGYCKLIDK